jgi:histidyl-tRNA synthetase
MIDTDVKLSAVKGMPDILPAQIAVWQFLEKTIRALLMNYAYKEIRTPIFERTQLFARSIGEVTDIVEKEMYTFLDRNDESITIRPEGTAGCVRACIEHSLLRNQQQQKLWYLGPMCRYERPQKGRFRQFTQLGVEAFNLYGPDIEAEQISLCYRLWRLLGVDHLIILQINSIGNLASRDKYKQVLVEYFNANIAQLDEDSQRRLHTNPLRVLDSKNPEMQDLLAKAPVLLDYLDVESLQHFQELQQYLQDLGIKFAINPRLVRGLDYYNRTVYEWVTDQLGSQSAVCAGGRYDNLVANLGGPDAPGVGFAIGLERLILLLEVAQRQFVDNLDGYLLCVGVEAESKRLFIAERLRDLLPNFSLQTHMGSGSFGSLLKKADKSGAKVALIVGDEEIANSSISIKFLRQDLAQQTVLLDDVQQVLGDI